jgi:hypothetical protein
MGGPLGGSIGLRNNNRCVGHVIAMGRGLGEGGHIYSWSELGCVWGM